MSAFEIRQGDALELLRALAPDSVDACVTDPPYNLGFMGRAWDTHGEHYDAAFGYYLAGLIDGEGHFRVQGQHGEASFSCAFALKLRRDDRAILERAAREVGIGSVYDTTGDSNPMAVWRVQSRGDCVSLVGYLMRFPLRAKKVRDFYVWAEAVAEWANGERGNRWSGPRDWSRMASLKGRLERSREYREPPWSGNAYQDWSREWAEEAFRVLKPGAHLVAFGGTRTFHRLTCALEDAGFEVRDCLMWLYGSGFPKSLDVSKAIDKAAGAAGTWRREDHPGRAGARTAASSVLGQAGDHTHADNPDGLRHVYEPATDAARQWAGWGTALKPAWEPIVLARKPLAGTVAANVQAHGTGALNVDGCRIGTSKAAPASPARARQNVAKGAESDRRTDTSAFDTNIGRWPANVVLDEDAAAQLDAQAGDTGAFAPVRGTEPSSKTTQVYSGWNRHGPGAFHGDRGGASRFFYTAKASSGERHYAGKNAHPTVKPVDLMRWLCRLVTPPGGLVLDPFTGSGSTGVAALAEGFRFLGFEREAEYVETARRRIAGPLFAQEEPTA